MSTATPKATKLKHAPVDNRKRFYTLLAIGKEQLGYDDEYYYGMWLPMQGATKNAEGKYSATTMNIGQLSAAVERMVVAGFKPTAKGCKKFTHANKDWRAPRIAKLNALWCELFDKGHVKDKSQAALEKWAKTYTQKDRLQWAGSKELNTSIEQLKQWLARPVKAQAEG